MSRVDYFRMELNAIESTRGVFNGGDWAGSGGGRNGKTAGQSIDHVAVAHPDLLLNGGVCEQPPRPIHGECRQSKLALVAFAD